ncbi:MAG: SUMF1/EgtB/PvdO family nonheme iron enzyme [Desulfovibrionales bacterium]|nr:SUMF1/EgtB/PvdO family nonheme iron enzyme [Desulfovibrionales bacterium]
MATTVISLKGIDEAISNLNYRDHKTLKYRLIHAVREFYESENAVTTLQGIDTDRLVTALWDTGDDPSAIKPKRKNLSSIKSSVNADFKRLYEDGKNPEGIIIGRGNIFVMSDEAKDRMLTSFTGSAKKDGGVTLEQINEVLNIVREVLSDPEALANTGNSDRTGKLSQLKNIIQGLSQQIGLKVAHGDLTDGPAAPSEVRAYETHMAHGDTKDNDNPPTPPFTKGEDILSPPLGRDGGLSIPSLKKEESQIPPLEKGDTGGFSGEKTDTLPRISGNAAETGSEQNKDEVGGTGIESGVEGYGPGVGEADGREGTTSKEAPAAESTEDAASPEEIAANEVDVVDTVELVEEIIPEEPGSEKLENIGETGEYLAETEIVDDIESDETGDDLDEVEVVEDLVEKAPEEAEEVPAVVEEADLIEDLEPEEIGPEESEELQDTNEVVEEEVEEAIQEIVEAEEEAEPQGDTEIVDEAGLLPDAEPEDAVPEEMEEVEEVAEDNVQETLAEVIDDQPEIEAEETGSTEDLEPAELTDNLEEAEVVDEIAETKPEGEEVTQDDAEVADEAEIMEKAPEEELEPEEMGDIEEVEEDEAEEGIEELEITEKSGEPGLSASGSEAGYSDGIFGEEDKIPRARLLAEEFNRLLGDRERFYNQYILIPAGDYIVGNKSPGKDERPEQKVRLEAFYMGRFPVTNALFEVFVEKTGYKTIAERLGYGKVYYGRFKKTVDAKTGSIRLICQSGLSCETVYGTCWHQPSGPGTTIHNKRNHPVVQVSREDAMAFAAWTGKRLPTEDEWEAATRTADGYALPWGNDWQRDVCNIEASSIADTTPVDRHMDSGNNFGIIDAIGNVLEWTMEPCNPPSYARHDVKYYVAKGGSWISGNDIRLFNRFKLEAEMHSNILGFRCVAY